MQVTMGSSQGGPSHLVLVFCVTAGKNGEDLGSDEEQIVNLVYMLYDVANNKVVSLQSHYVKPLPDEESETILTEECREVTGMDENDVRNGQPLDCVLEELDRFLMAKGVHPDKGGRSFVVLTDGPCHVRQCVHREANVKKMALPAYFGTFYDLRREVLARYKDPQLIDLESILDYLGLAGDQSVEYGVRHCQNMAAILSRLIFDGHTFGEPQVVNERLEGGICMKTEIVDDNTVVRARGLPWQSSDQDIAHFFKGLNIAKGGVALCLGIQGRRNGEALIRFVSEEQRDLALRRHKHHMGQRYIEVYKASGKDFINVAGGSSTEAQAFLSRGSQTIIRMRGLPFTATTQQVLEFFAREPDSCEVLDGEEGVLFVHYPDGRSTGDAFVLFSSEEESLRALRKHKHNMGPRYIELFKSTTAEVQQVLNRSMDPRSTDPAQGVMATTAMLTPFPSAAFPYHLPQNLITYGSHHDCLRVRNLPPAAQVTDILTFLGPWAQYIRQKGVHMVFTAQGHPSGDAFIQMDSEDAAYLTAMDRNNQAMVHGSKSRHIPVQQVSGDDMSLILTNGVLPSLSAPLPPHMMAPIPHLTPFPTPHSMPFSALPQGPVSLPQHPIITANGMMAASSLQVTAPPLQQPGQASLGTLPLAQLPASLQIPANPALTSVTPRQPYYPHMIYWYPPSPLPHPDPCAVVMRGLPHNVTVPDVLNYFQGFSEVTSKSVQLQTGVDGELTGDAVVTFTSRGEAERAIVERNSRPLGHRFIELFMA
ncbi:hypothetical protein ACOMHN_017958 [Nucella lapillus]